LPQKWKFFPKKTSSWSAKIFSVPPKLGARFPPLRPPEPDLPPPPCGRHKWMAPNWSSLLNALEMRLFLHSILVHKNSVVVSMLDCQLRSSGFRLRPGLHLCLLANSAMMNTLTIHCRWEDETARTGISFASYS